MRDELKVGAAMLGIVGVGAVACWDQGKWSGFLPIAVTFGVSFVLYVVCKKAG